MPFSKKRFPRKPRKKPFSKRKFPVRRRTRKSVVPRLISNNIGLAPTKRVKLSYHESVGMTSTSGILAFHRFQLNTLFDPDISATGHQPFGRDQWAALYNKYLVTSATIKVKWANIATNNIPHVCGITLDKDTTNQGNLDTRLERQQGLATNTLLANSNAHTTTSAVYGAKSFFTLQYPTDSHQVGSTFGSSPTLPAYAIVWIQPVDSVSSSAAIIYGQVTIEFNVLLSDPIELGGS